jgi:hypothetical protein
MAPWQKSIASVWLLVAHATTAAASESVEFVVEHLPEALMDNRFASLPIWSWQIPESGALQQRVALGYTRTGAGSAKLGGALVSAAAQRSINKTWSFTALGFMDRASFHSGQESRIFQPEFATNIPLALPATGIISKLRGSALDLGAGLVFTRNNAASRIGAHRLLLGVVWQRLQMRDYTLDYRLTSGASNGASGIMDYSGSYTFFSPIIGIEWQRQFGNWNLAPHVLAAIPLPRRGVQGRIAAPGFDIRGDTADVGAGKHVGDSFLGLGAALTYRPLGLTMDVGSTLSQAFVEKLTHKGLDQNLVVSIEYQF